MLTFITLQKYNILQFDQKMVDIAATALNDLADEHVTGFDVKAKDFISSVENTTAWSDLIRLSTVNEQNRQIRLKINSVPYDIFNYGKAYDIWISETTRGR